MATTEQELDYQEIIVATNKEARDVLDAMRAVISSFELVTVSDLYDLVGLQPTHVHDEWGWFELNDVDVKRVNSGYLLDLPKPEKVWNKE